MLEFDLMKTNQNLQRNEDIGNMYSMYTNKNQPKIGLMHSKISKQTN